MSQDLMNYEHMTQQALRSVVRDAIRRVIREDGLPGSHHFYITFLTRFPGVEIDKKLAEKYAEEITIVIEHQFWDLTANADSFEVTLKFGGVPKYLKVPYASVTRFHDPSVGFALQFEPPQEMEETAPTLTMLTPPVAAKATPEAVTDRPPAAPAAKDMNTDKDQKKKPGRKSKSADSADKANTASDENVVSLDSFRKK